jgi:GxxExxY protein
MSLHVCSKLSEETEVCIHAIIGAAIDVHKELGPGYLEKTYEKAMAVELRERDIPYRTQAFVDISYKGIKIHNQILDMIVDDKVIVEFKAVDNILKTHEAQILSYLKSTGLAAGLLINFNAPMIKHGIRRFVR